MKKRLTEPQFQEAIKGLDVGAQTLDIARGVLIDGKAQKEFATALGLSGQSLVREHYRWSAALQPALDALDALWKEPSAAARPAP